MALSVPSFHVAGVLVQLRPEAVGPAGASIARMAGAVVHVADPAGKLVVTLESEHASEIAEGLTRLQTLPGVISALLVSEHYEPLPAAEETVDDASRKDPP